MQERTESWPAEPAFFLVPLALRAVETVDSERRTAGITIKIQEDLELRSDTEDAVGGDGLQDGK